MGDYLVILPSVFHIVAVCWASWLYLTDRNWHFWAFVALLWGQSVIAQV